MNTATLVSVPSVKSKVSAEEWQTRVDLAACYRLVASYGWDDLVFTHITAKIPGVENQFLINPYGMFFSEITASSLVKIDLNGNKLDADNPFPINPAGFTIHSAIHAARHDAKCVLHVHTPNGVAVSAQKRRNHGAQRGRHRVRQGRGSGARQRRRVGGHRGVVGQDRNGVARMGARQAHQPSNPLNRRSSPYLEVATGRGRSSR